ncbi:MAG: phosphotransferase [Candidatus Eremiobacteraeota bacterium]|nr:phosphotransferase [Candidatus Eremiobacteraeota bacterium]
MRKPDDDLIHEMTGRFLPGSGAPGVTALTKGGSDRDFFRLSRGGETAVLCVTTNREELDYYLALGSFFFGEGIPVPRFFCWSLERGFVLMEDCGSLSVHEKVHGDPGEEELFSLYRSVLSELVKLQSLDSGRCEHLGRRPFDYDTLRWETGYFREHFLGTLMKDPESTGSALEETFHRMACEVALLPRVPMHRDFQSQNILVRQGSPFFIDFQGSRTGSPFYDVASLLLDPYVELPEHLHDRLLEEYFRMVSLEGFSPGSYGRFRDNYLLTAHQRLMQALGAYGNLGINKGKRQFLSHVPAALRLLERVVTRSGRHPELIAVVRRSMERLSSVTGG